MKNVKNVFLPLLLIVLGITGCSRNNDVIDDPVNPTPTEKAEPVNDFVWKGMNSWYYWQDKTPNLADNAFKSEADYVKFVNGKDPEALFNSLLYKPGEVDRFSWIVSDVDELLAGFQGVSRSPGMDYTLFRIGDSGVGALVNYVIPNSPSEAAGVRRGDFIFGINGADMTLNNYQALQDNQFSIRIAHEVHVENGTISVDDVEEVSITAVQMNENPVAFYKKFDINGKKIGYLVYNGFQSSYNGELNAAFAQMKADGVTDLILDLRYNGGGSVETAVALGQMVTGQFTGSPYVSMDFNNKKTPYSSVELLSNQVNLYDSNGDPTGQESVNSLNLSKVYVLTTNGTASASELTIDGLSAYIDVVKIGETTYGKFVGSITLYDDASSDFLNYNNRKSNWAMQPITFAYYNGKGDAHPEVTPNNPTGGIEPDYEVDFFEYLGTMKEFGERSDLALDRALELITGVSASAQGLMRPSAMLKSKTASRASLKTTFIGTRKTLSPFGTELYLENPTKK